MTLEIKRCTKCQISKNLLEFDLCSKTKCGRRSVCKICRKKERFENKDSIKKHKKEYYEKNKSIVLEKAKIYKEKNKSTVLEKAKQYREENKLKVKISKRNSTNKKLKSDGFFRMKIKMRKYVKRYFNQTDKSKKTKDIVGCEPSFLREYFEKKFESWMNWDNYGSYWSIDHIIPVCKFNLTNEDEKLKCWNWSNLIPATIKYNSSKKDTIDKIQIYNTIKQLEKFKEEGSTTKWFSEEVALNLETYKTVLETEQMQILFKI